MGSKYEFYVRNNEDENFISLCGFGVRDEVTTNVESLHCFANFAGATFRANDWELW
jgi:hypothetical protein